LGPSATREVSTNASEPYLFLHKGKFIKEECTD
jgi:hypothetical protein